MSDYATCHSRWQLNSRLCRQTQQKCSLFTEPGLANSWQQQHIRQQRLSPSTILDRAELNIMKGITRQHEHFFIVDEIPFYEQKRFASLYRL